MTLPAVPTAPSPETPIPRRIDLHCHSDASNRAAEVLLNAISCPECYSTPQQVHAQAKLRGMDFVTITDHDSIAGVAQIAGRADVLVGEELTCWFPEDDCKLHLLVWGHSAAQHEHLQGIAKDIYAVAQYVHREQLAHAVAHPIYRQNDKLERWHLERLLVLFKGFECLNGAHSALHRDAFEPLLDQLCRASLARLAEKHNLAPLGSEPWIKARVGGSDDHGLLNIGRTWTEFPAGVATPAEVLQCLRDGTCKPGGESGSASKLAHTFYSVAVRYYSRDILAASKHAAPANLTTTVLQVIAGEAAMPSKAKLIGRKVKGTLLRLGKRLAAPFCAPPPPSGTALLRQIFLESARRRLAERPSLKQALAEGLPPLGEHDEMFRFVQSINRDVTSGLAAAIGGSVDHASFTELFDAIASLLAQQFVLAPYYFTVFHQNRERRLLREITGQRRRIDAANLKVGLFTDTLDEINGVSRFLADMSAHAHQSGFSLTLHTCSAAPKIDLPNRKDFAPLLSRPLPYYADLKLILPPIIEILEWSDRQQFDAVHVSTPGPMGLVGWLVAKMLRVPLLGTYHTDFPAYVRHYTRDHRATHAAEMYLGWLYRQAATVFTRTAGYVHALRNLGLDAASLATLPPGVHTGKFNPARRDEGLWRRLGVREPHRLLYVGRLGAEKNLGLLSDVFRRVCRCRHDVALVVAGSGPCEGALSDELRGLPVHLLGPQTDAVLPTIYASADLLLFPSRTDTLGQVVLEAQASGLPALVSTEGGPKEIIEHEVTGLALPATGPALWSQAVEALLGDSDRRAGMSLAAARRAQRFSLGKTFEMFWSAHVAAAAAAAESSADPAQENGALLTAR
jgi:glycosyltransferase involved in cell wall biosynthesis